MQDTYLITPDGAQLRYGVFPAPVVTPRGTVLGLHGRRECLEIYREMLSEWHARGFDVVAMDWRGQGGSGRALADRHKHHIDSFTTYRKDLQFFYERIVRPSQRGPLILFAHSMGGCIGLEWLAHERPDVKAVLLAAPMLALPIPVWGYGALRSLAQAMVHLGWGDAYIPGEKRFEAPNWVFEGNPLTQDPRRFRFLPDCFAVRPDLSLGGVTWGWLNAALEALERLRRQLPEIMTPTLILNSGQDSVIPSAQLSHWAKLLPNATEIVFPTARHCLMLETDALREEAWQAMDRFLAAQTAYFS